MAGDEEPLRGGADTPPPPSNSSNGGDSGGDGRRARGLVVKALCLLGGALLIRKLAISSSSSRRKSSQWEHTSKVVASLTGEKFSTEQAMQDPQTYFNLRLNTCSAAELADGSKVLYAEQAFWRTPEKPYRQRLLKVKPGSIELKCDVEVSAYSIRDTEEYRNFCDRPENQRPQSEEVIADMADHLTTVHLSRCEKGEQCLYKGSTPPGGFPNSWNEATTCTSELKTFKDGEVHSWDRGFNSEGTQVWGVQKGPYEFKPVTANSNGIPGTN